MAEKTTKQILEDALPGLEEAPAPTGPAGGGDPPRPGASMAELKKKFLGTPAPPSASDATPAPAAGNSFTVPASAPPPAMNMPNVKVFQARPKTPPADPVDDPGPRTFIADEDGLVGGRG